MGLFSRISPSSVPASSSPIDLAGQLVRHKTSKPAEQAQLLGAVIAASKYDAKVYGQTRPEVLNVEDYFRSVKNVSSNLACVKVARTSDFAKLGMAIGGAVAIVASGCDLVKADSQNSKASAKVLSAALGLADLQLRHISGLIDQVAEAVFAKGSPKGGTDIRDVPEKLLNWLSINAESIRGTGGTDDIAQVIKGFIESPVD